MEYVQRHPLLWALARPFVRLFWKLRLGYNAPSYSLGKSFLLVSNHVTKWDERLIRAAFRRPLTFARREEVSRRVRADGGAGFFPEEERCWDGVTRPIPVSVGALVKKCGATLVTFRLTGGYFAAPRWAETLRRGRIRGERIGVYPPETLAGMSDAEISSLIARDIHEDACETQRTHPAPYRGKRLAEHLETLLFICPKCGTMHRMVSRDDRFFCDNCGMSTRYTLSGHFSGGNVPFHNVRDWVDWQTGKLRTLCQKAGDTPIFADEGFELRSLSSHGAERIGRGELLLYRDRLELPAGISLPVREITGLSLPEPGSLHITTRNGSRFAVYTERVLCLEKYRSACACLGAAVD